MAGAQTEAFIERTERARESLRAQALGEHGVCALGDAPARRLVEQVALAAFGEIREVPAHRHVGLAGDEDVRRRLDVAHVRLDQQATAEHGLEVTPADLTVAVRADADATAPHLAQVTPL